MLRAGSGAASRFGPQPRQRHGTTGGLMTPWSAISRPTSIWSGSRSCRTASEPPGIAGQRRAARFVCHFDMGGRQGRPFRRFELRRWPVAYPGRPNSCSAKVRGGCPASGSGPGTVRYPALATPGVEVAGKPAIVAARAGKRRPRWQARQARRPAGTIFRGAIVPRAAPGPRTCPGPHAAPPAPGRMPPPGREPQASCPCPSRSPASIRIGSRFSAGVSGHENRMSYTQDG